MKNFIRHIVFGIFVLLNLSICINAQPLPPGRLIAHYPFIGDANDISGNQHDGVVNGAVLTSDRFGNANNAYLFDGSDNIQINDHPDFDFLNFDQVNRVTISVWFKPNNANGEYLITKEAGINILGPYSMDFSTGVPRILLYNNVGGVLADLSGTSQIQVGVWQHMAFTFNGSEVKLFYNGQLEASKFVSGNLKQSDGKVSIGFSSFNNQYYEGSIDDIYFYNYALTSSEITDLYQTGPELPVPPTASFTITPMRVYEISFNAAGSSDDGTIVSWNWDFGDGTTGTGQVVNHTYENGNPYPVTLTVTDDDGEMGILSQTVTPIIVNLPPTVRFTTTPIGVYGIVFNGTSSTDDGTIVGWNWDFGDGTTGLGPTINHTYQDSSTYMVTLTLTDDDGDTGILKQTVTPIIVNIPPVAKFTATPTGVYGINFNGTSSSDDGTIVSWDWDFGDGSTGSGATINHAYQFGNTYTVTLTVRDNLGKTGLLSLQVTPVDMIGGQTVKVGYTTVYTKLLSGLTRRAQQVTSPSSGAIRSLSLYHGGGTGGIFLAVYSDNAGKPGTKLGETLITTASLTQGWQEFVLVNPVPVVAGQKVWLAWLTQTKLRLRYTSGTPGRIDSGRPWAEGMPANFGTGTSANTIYSLYANVVVSSGNTRESSSFSTATTIEKELDQITVYPNPFNHYFNVDLQVVEDNSPIRMTLLDLSGKIIGTLVDDQYKTGQHTIGLDNLSNVAIKSGVYILKVELNGGTYFKRLLRH